jgi:hypothetical protein
MASLQGTARQQQVSGIRVAALAAHPDMFNLMPDASN